jgi:DNA repair exonuclease SbcCD nuclease subunit
MRVIPCADLHIRSTAPEYRIDQYEEAIFNKLRFITNLADTHDAIITISGDIFDSIKVTPRLINSIEEIFSKCKRNIYTVPGQHDLEKHSTDLTSSPYLTLINTECIIDVDSKCVDNIFGIGWNGKLANEKIDNKSILLMHKCVTPKEPPFFLKDSALSANEVLKKYPKFKMIFTGDYHVPHAKVSFARMLINCGTIMRNRIDLIDYKPFVWIVDIETKKAKKFMIPIQPSEKVFSIPKSTIDEDLFSKHIEELVKIRMDKNLRPDFIEVVRMLAKESNVTDRVIKLAEKYYEEARNAIK